MHPTFVRNNAVIPVMFEKKFSKPQRVWVRGRKGYKPSCVDTVHYLPVELGFFITFHKAQGQIILRLILPLSKRPHGLTQISHAGLFVDDQFFTNYYGGS